MKSSSKTLLLAALVAATCLSRVAAQKDPLRPTVPSLVRPMSPTKTPGADGFIQRWVILEPIPRNGQLTDGAIQAAVKNEYFPNQLAVIPHDGDKVTVGGAELA